MDMRIDLYYPKTEVECDLFLNPYYWLSMGFDQPLIEECWHDLKSFLFRLKLMNTRQKNTQIEFAIGYLPKLIKFIRKVKEAHDINLLELFSCFVWCVSQKRLGLAKSPLGSDPRVVVCDGDYEWWYPSDQMRRAQNIPLTATSA